LWMENRKSKPKKRWVKDLIKEIGEKLKVII
jgi:hypothetical protein